MRYLCLIGSLASRNRARTRLSQRRRGHNQYLDQAIPYLRLHDKLSHLVNSFVPKYSLRALLEILVKSATTTEFV